MSEDGHDWEDQPLRRKDLLEFDAAHPDGDEVHFHITMDIVLDVESLRTCRRCGQESVDGKDPKDSCDMSVVKRVMES